MAPAPVVVAAPEEDDDEDDWAWALARARAVAAIVSPVPPRTPPPRPPAVRMLPSQTQRDEISPTLRDAPILAGVEADRTRAPTADTLEETFEAGPDPTQVEVQALASSTESTDRGAPRFVDPPTLVQAMPLGARVLAVAPVLPPRRPALGTPPPLAGLPSVEAGGAPLPLAPRPVTLPTAARTVALPPLPSPSRVVAAAATRKRG
ncbi:MAG: hypothetical protein R2939_19580 [Kofleriaceae bacterium]